MNWFKKLIPARIRVEGVSKRNIPEGIWVNCKNCGAMLYKPELERCQFVCNKCNHHMRISARQRLGYFLDTDSMTELASDVVPLDFLKFKDVKRYKDRLTLAKKNTGENDALVVMAGTLRGIDVVAAAFEFSFLGGSMGSVVGEKFVQAIRFAIKEKRSFICFSSSGGARMQEGLISLMQMAKTSSAVDQLKAERIPFVSVLTDPTTGGVSASLSMLGDIIIAEPDALIGFAGPRVIEQTVGTVLPEGFQKSEFLLTHGAIDMIVHRKDLRSSIAKLIGLLYK
ncbi:MAG: acetyl-CoA carboxylase, carboxyltransferase subunit beta [Pseudomonadota bacterium]|nr:acetyl-CoA carboxylase, carboxyltransferase subunit beta [Pseudomonadota bacterium]